jgi:hypothetical protein
MFRVRVWGQEFTSCCPKVVIAILDQNVGGDKISLTNNYLLTVGRQLTLCQTKQIQTNILVTPVSHLGEVWGTSIKS